LNGCWASDEVIDPTKAGDDIGRGLSAGSDKGVNVIEKFLLGRSIVATDARAFIRVGA